MNKQAKVDTSRKDTQEETPYTNWKSLMNIFNCSHPPSVKFKR